MKKVIAVLVVLILAISNIVVYATPVKGFKDVPNNFWANSYINKMNSSGYFKGYPDNTFRPENNISRLEFMIMLSRVVSNLYRDSIVIKQNDLKDVYVDNDVKGITWALEDYKKMTMYLYLFDEYKESANEGKQILINAFGPKLEPGKNITRAEAADILYNLYNKSDIYIGSSKLKDITNHKFKLQIQSLESVGILGGYPDNTFKPDNGITRAEMSKIVDTLIKKKIYLQNIKYNSAEATTVNYDKYLAPIDVIKTVLTQEKSGDYLDAYQYYSNDAKKEKGYSSYLDYMKTKLAQVSFNMQMYDPKILEYKEVKVDANTTKVYFRKYNSVLEKTETVKIRELVMKNDKWYIDFKFIPSTISDWN